MFRWFAIAIMFFLTEAPGARASSLLDATFSGFVVSASVLPDFANQPIVLSSEIGQPFTATIQAQSFGAALVEFAVINLAPINDVYVANYLNNQLSFAYAGPFTNPTSITMQGSPVI